MASSNKMRVVLLASEWRTKCDELSTFNRELAIQLAKHCDVQVSVFLPRCDQDEESAALKHNITLVQATRRPGYDETHWLCFPPKNLQMDFAIGHGVELGRQVHVIRESHNCKWVQFVHTDPEELGMFKDCSDAISQGEKKRRDEIDLCVSADFVVAVGSKVAEAYQSYLRFCKKDQNVFVLTPGIFSDFSDIPQSSQDGSKCRVLVFGHGNAEDFSLKGFDIAAKAVAKLNDAYLIFVGAKKQEEIAGQLKEYDIPPSRLRVRSLTEIREHLEKQFSEVDLAIMPSRTEGFGLTALEAMSAGLPVLVSGNSGLGEALMKVAFGSQYVIDSEDAEVWAAEIKKVWTKRREIRLQESKTVRHSYAAKYNWEEQCRDLVEKMKCIVNEHSSSGAAIPEVAEQEPDADVLGAVNQPHLPQPAVCIGERNVSRTNEEDTVTLSKQNAKSSGKRRIQSESTSDQGKTLALPEGVVKSIKSQSCDPEGVVVQLQENLQLNPSALDNPKRWIRCFANAAKSENRKDIVQHLRTITPAGTTGPLLDEDLDVRCIPFKQRKELTFSLCGGDEWKLLAEKLGMSYNDIRFLDKRTTNPCDVVLDLMANHRYLSVGKIYDQLVESGLARSADLL